MKLFFDIWVWHYAHSIVILSLVVYSNMMYQYCDLYYSPSVA